MPLVEPQPLDLAGRLAILHDTPGLAGIDPEDLSALAEAMEVWHHPYKAVLSRLGDDVSGRPLRIMLVGSCLTQTPGIDDTRRVIHRGMIFGEEGLVTWAAGLGLIAAVPGGLDDYYAYAAEEVLTLELPAARFAELFGGGGHPELLRAARQAGWKRVRGPELIEVLHQSAELGRATPDQLYGLLEGGTLRIGEGDLVDDDGSKITVVLAGNVTLWSVGDEASQVERSAGAVIGQGSWLRGVDDQRLRQIGELDQEALVLQIPTDHYERELRSDPELTAAIARTVSELVRPTYRTEVSLILATQALQLALPLAAMTAALAQTIRANLFDTTWVVQVVWEGSGVDPSPQVIEVPHGPPAEITAALQAGLIAILDASGDAIDVLLVDPSALRPDAEVQRALLRAVADVSAPNRVSYLFADPAEWVRILDLVGPLILRTSLLPTVVLNPEGPAPGLGGALDDVAQGALGGGDEGALARGLRALPAFARGQLQRLAAGGPRELLRTVGFDPQRFRSGGPVRVWPIKSVRLRLSVDGQAALARGGEPPEVALEDDRQSFRRWARAITGRRVGVSLGGAGALSYVCVPLVRDLLASGVPIDMVSGTSFGSIVGTYYAALGEAGLELIVRHWYWAQITVAWGWLSTRPLQKWINLDLGFVDLAALSLPMIPVATNAYNGREWDLRAGLVGHCCAASGSLPPLAPTYDHGTRCLDGALSADTPNRVLVESGAAMVVGVNSVPSPWPEPPPPTLPFPILNDLYRELNPITRLTDSIRGYGMLFRQAAQSQAYAADVTYAADPLIGNGATFFLRHAIVYQAEHSDSLRQAVALARARWTELLSRPPRAPRQRPGAAAGGAGAAGGDSSDLPDSSDPTRGDASTRDASPPA